jgi:hypothetical protein
MSKELEGDDIIQEKNPRYSVKPVCTVIFGEAKNWKGLLDDGAVIIGLTYEKHERIIKEKDQEIAGLNSTVRKYEELKKKIERRRDELRSWQCKEADELTELLR